MQGWRLFSHHKPSSSTSTSADLSRNFHHQGYYYHPLSGKDIGDISHTGTVSLLSTAEASGGLPSKIGWPVHSPSTPCHMPTSSQPAQDFCFIYKSVGDVSTAGCRQQPVHNQTFVQKQQHCSPDTIMLTLSTDGKRYMHTSPKM